MRLITLVLVSICFNVYADSVSLITTASGWSSAMIVCTPFNLSTDCACASLELKIPKIILVKPDAAAYVASNDEIKAIYLEQALMIPCKEYPNSADMELAKAILAY